jgi:methyl-accepting chemotaxis protein
MKMKKIGTRIIATVLFCSIAMASIVGFISILRSRNVIEKIAKESLLKEGQVHSESFNNELIIYETINTNIFQLIDGVIEVGRLEEEGYLTSYVDNILDPMVSRIIKETKDCIGISIAFDPKFTGKTEGAWWKVNEAGDIDCVGQNEISGKSPDDPSVSWYYNAIKAGEGIWSDPYTNDADLYVMSYTRPLMVDDMSIGVVIIDMNVEGVKSIIDEIKLYDTGYAFLLSKDYDYLIHPTLDSSVNLKTVDDGKYDYIVKEIENRDSYVLDTDFGGERKAMVFSKLLDDKILVLTVPKAEILKDMYDTTYMILVVMVISAILATIISLVLGKKISNPIVLVTKILDTTANLDLSDIEETKEIQAILSRKDEIGAILRATAILREELREVIRTIEETTKNVVENTGYLTTATTETSQSITDVARTIEELAQATMGQAEDAETGSTKLMNLANDIRIAVENGEIVVESSNEAQEINKVGLQEINDMVEKFDVTTRSTNMVSKNINSLLEKSQAIGDILNTIVDISEQTNLLALNAAIEAARAGEAGKGFAVVAEEIRKLSEGTGEATENIEGILKAIQDEVEITKKNMDLSEGALKEVNASLGKSSKAFEDIDLAVIKSMKAIAELREKLDMIDNNKEEVILAIESISSVTEETAASTEELSASMEEQAATVETISQNADDLASIIDKLYELVNKFKI